MLYDFHIHTREYSDCSISSAEEMCQRAVDSGLAGIALTEHDLWWPLADIQKLQQRFPTLTIIRGMEYSCPEGHFLVFLPEPENGSLPGYRSVVDLIPLVHRHGGIVIWAHPFRSDKARPSWLKHVRPDGMEVASSNMHRRAEAKARKVAAQRGILTFRNSDAHHANLIGEHRNNLESPVTCVEEFITYVRQRSAKKTGNNIFPVGAAF
jgi:predicted metal-dependent phosphoesterase TrpH